MTDTTKTYSPSPEYLDLLRRRREAAKRLGITPQQRETIRRSKSPSTGTNEFVDRPADPHEKRFDVRSPPLR